MDLTTAKVYTLAAKRAGPLPHEPVGYQLCRGGYEGIWFTAPGADVCRDAMRWLRECGWDRLRVTLTNGQNVTVRLRLPFPSRGDNFRTVGPSGPAA